ncbi:hypothetical protein PIB30_025882 [Stylosanthes scabra]|uniref:Uncharacterized protein n=1 Tax=Stylosanthes scabra TaxID=79078 RepID=A0ABU6XA93_9FABA|nr:hypothetical protein [Stylosanthes scabra]
MASHEGEQAAHTVRETAAQQQPGHEIPVAAASAATEQPKEGTTTGDAQKEEATAPEKTEEKPQDHKETPTTTGN